MLTQREKQLVKGGIIVGILIGTLLTIGLHGLIQNL